MNQVDYSSEEQRYGEQYVSDPKFASKMLVKVLKVAPKTIKHYDAYGEEKHCQESEGSYDHVRYWVVHFLVEVIIEVIARKKMT